MPANYAAYISLEAATWTLDLEYQQVVGSSLRLAVSLDRAKFVRINTVLFGNCANTVPITEQLLAHHAMLRYDGGSVSEFMGDITQLLHRWREGSSDAEAELFELVMPDLHRLAAYLMRRERADHTMQATELVDQIYVRLVAAKDRDWQGRKHFFAIAARAMRRYLIDHARARPDAEFLTLDGLENFLPVDRARIETALTVDRLLDRMAGINPDWCTLVELKYFLGLTDDEAADTMGVKLRTMQRMWSDARDWLFEQVNQSAPEQVSPEQVSNDEARAAVRPKAKSATGG
jgi:RNA polymerase sigma factor (TIGR02999 family)